MTDTSDLLPANAATTPPSDLSILIRTRPELILAPVLLVVILETFVFSPRMRSRELATLADSLDGF